MAVAASDDYGVCCDDRKAREAAADIVGQERVIGTLRLLQWCVQKVVMDCSVAFSAFTIMKEKGGFLPDTAQSFFCNDDC
jgi:predicted nucleic acid-binding protein